METTNVSTISATDVKKELYKTKVNAKFSHYVSGNAYYKVQLTEGVYQFPISTVEKNSLSSIEALVNYKVGELSKELIKLNPDEINLVANAEENKDPRVIEIRNEISTLNSELEKMITLSSDLGTTTFSDEMKGSELNRWIEKAIKNDDFIKIN